MGTIAAALVAGWMGVAAVAPTPGTAAKSDELARMEAQLEAIRAGDATTATSVTTTADRVEARQRFLAGLLRGKADRRQLADLLPRVSGTAKPAAAAQAGVLNPFAELEKRQEALAQRASSGVALRLRDVQALLDRLGLDRSRFLRAGGATGMGGPFVPATTSAGADGAMAALYTSWEQANDVAEALQSLPAFVPAANFRFTSPFGLRSDPFHGRAANHTGVDMAGEHGEPIMASAGGTVVRAGWMSGYGQVIDVDHGRGILTRYGHLSDIDVRVGDRVTIGQRIGAMGSTGRSTGTHLHFEVRVDGRPVDPKPFLQASSFTLAMQQGRMGPDLAPELASAQ